MSMHDKLQNIFRTVMGDDDLVLTDDLTAADVPAWDSLAHVGLMFSIESQLGLEFEEDQLTSFRNVGELRQFIEQHATGGRPFAASWRHRQNAERTPWGEVGEDRVLTSPTAAGLYLDLLKKTLTGTLVEREPDVDDWAYLRSFRAHYIRGPALTMTPQVRLDNARHCIEDAITRGVPGDLLEAGVWRGGMAIFLRAVLAAHGVTDRRVWVADSFQGLPEPDAEKFPLEARAHASRTMTEDFAHLAVSEADVRDSFAAFGLLDDQVRFLVGWFKDVLPSAPIDRLAVLRLDADYYESTMDTLTALYDKVSPGGYVIVDDYGERLWTYCRRAVDEFRKQRGITAKLVKVDTRCYFWQVQG